MKTMTIALLLGIALVANATAEESAFPATGGGNSADGAPSLEQRFQRLDKNRDGFITWQEAQPLRAAEFKQMDRNQDDELSADEWHGRAMPLAAFDMDSDGKVALSEYVGKHQSMFQAFDANHDNRIGPAEFAQAQAAARRD